MPVLDRVRHELFAQGLAQGKSQRDAYRAAGYCTESDADVDSNACRLAASDKIATRLAELVELGARRATITPERVAVELAKLGFADIRRAVKWDNVQRAREGADVGKADPDAPVVGGGEEMVLDNEVLLIPSAELDDDTAAAISEISQGQHGIKIKFHDKKAALAELGRMLGMFTDRAEISGPGGTGLTIQVVSFATAPKSD